MIRKIKKSVRPKINKMPGGDEVDHEKGGEGTKTPFQRLYKSGQDFLKKRAAGRRPSLKRRPHGTGPRSDELYPL